MCRSVKKFPVKVAFMALLQSITDGKAFLMMIFLFQFIYHGHSIVLNGNMAVTLLVND